MHTASRARRMPCPDCYGGSGWILTAKLGVHWASGQGTTVTAAKCCPRCYTRGVVPFEPMA